MRSTKHILIGIGGCQCRVLRGVWLCLWTPSRCTDYCI